MHRLNDQNLCLAGSALIRIWESLDVLLNAALVAQELNICTINQDTTFLLQLDIFITSQRCEPPILADNDLLAAGELVHRSSEGFNGSGSVGVSSSYGEEDLTNVDTGDCAVWLTPSTTHSSLQSIGTGAGQHLVDSDNMVGVCSNSEMETFLASHLDKIPVAVSFCIHNLCRILTYLLAQIRAASSASELSCSYSLETMWTQRGNSSTFARFRPRSKIRIFGSGTPLLNLDFGYGYHH